MDGVPLTNQNVKLLPFSTMTRIYIPVVCSLLSVASNVHGQQSSEARILKNAPSPLIAGKEGKSSGSIIDWSIVQDSRAYGPFLAWKKADGSVAQLTNAPASLDLLIRDQIKAANLDTSSSTFRNFLTRTVKQYFSRKGAFIVSPENEVSFAKFIADKATESSRAKINASVIPYKEIFGGISWSIQFSMVSEDGAIETVLVEGELRPFSIKQVSQKIASASGVLPKIDFVPVVGE